MPFVGVTRLHIHNILRAPRFFWHIRKTARETQRAPGFLAGRLAKEEFTGFWTITVWMDQAAMRDYLRDRPHRAAMPRLRVWCDEASIAHWQQDSARLPTATEVLDHMVDQGRQSEVITRPGPARRSARTVRLCTATRTGPDAALPHLTGGRPDAIRASTCVCSLRYAEAVPVGEHFVDMPHREFRILSSAAPAKSGR